jgi:hypothetical protein
MTIIKCQTWEEIAPHVQDWVLLDLNHVLFEGTDLALSSRCHGVRQSYKKKWKAEGTYLKHWGNLLKQWRFKLIHPLIPQWIEGWKREGHVVLGLTSHPTGTFGKVRDIGNERLRPLREFNIEFSNLFPNYIFKNLPLPHPELKDGVLISGAQLKGIVLSNFFKKVLKRENLPKHILFVDDQKSNLESVKKCCDIWKIEFTGILFKPVKEEIEIDLELIRNQFEAFEKSGIWVGDQQTKVAKLS